MAGAFDPDVWSADVAALFRERSAVIRSGATVLLADDGVRVPYLSVDDVVSAARHFPAGGPADPPRATVTQSRLLHPAASRLVAELLVPAGLVAAVGDDARLLAPLKDVLARALALAADHAFLNGADEPLGTGPEGIIAAVAQRTVGDATLDRHRGLVYDAHHRRGFGRAGWILTQHVAALIAEDATAESLIEVDRERPYPGAIVPDGRDGGTLLGFPYVMSDAAAYTRGYRSFFALDWGEAWLVAREGLVHVDITTDPDTAGTVIRAEIHHDFAVRRPDGFLVCEPTPRP